jgi:nucleotide-binding universal stress UspA family protein
MQTVIVPLDFSQTSFNAAHYAAKMYKGKDSVRFILYHFYNSGESTSMGQHYLDSLKEELAPMVPNIETELESGDNFIDSLAAFAHIKGAYLIVMGLTGKNPSEQRFSGSNTLKMTEKNICPILIIPEDAVHSSISNVMITSELKYVEETPALLAVKRVLSEFKPFLHVLHVDSEVYISLKPELKAERDKMEVLLSEFSPEFYFMRLYDFHESVDLFARDKDIDMIVIAPRYHSFFERLFKTQHTKKLIYQSKVPVLAVHE